MNIIENLTARYTRARAGTERFIFMYKRGYELSGPNYNNVSPGTNAGTTGQSGVYDSTVCRAADAFVNTFISTMFPPQTRWIQLEASRQLIASMAAYKGKIPTSDEIEKENSKLMPQYEMITDVFFDALNQSNFYAVIDQFAHDVFLGMGVLTVQRSEDIFESASVLDFSVIPPLDVSVEISANQKITAVFRKRKVRYSQISYIWKDFDLSKLQQTTSDKNEEPEFEMLECCVLDPEYEVDKVGNRLILSRWHYYVICQNKICFEERRLNNPFIIFFWSLAHGENMGRGLLTKLLPDAEELQQMVKLKKQWVQLYAMGVYTAVASMLINPAMAKIRPNSVITVKEQGAIQPLHPAGNPQVQQLHIQELQRAIKESSLDITVPTDPNMTATQVSYIAQRQLQLFSGIVGRIQFQLLWPIVQNVLDILIQSGQIEIPQEIGKISPGRTQLKILSPIGRVQYQSDFNSLITAVSTLGQISPELVSTYVSLEKLPAWIFKQTGSPSKLLRTLEEVEDMKASREQQLMAQQAVEQQAITRF